ncbi:MAG: tetratricopeptide repeat protein [Isosphaeraceae bacterium]
MKEAVKALPGDRQTREAFALWLLQNDRPDEAKTEAEAAAAAVAPEVLKTLTYLQGLIARHRKDHAAAVRLFEAVLKESADDFAASNQLALALIESDDSAPRQRAQELAERNVQRQPKSAEALATLGWIYFRLGRVDAAERALSAATSGGDLSCDTAYYLAQILVQKGRIAEARAMIASAVKAPGRFTFRNDARAWLAQNQAAPQSGPTRP